MEPLENEFESKAAKNKAKRNAVQMKSNIMKLVQIFKDEQLQNKLQREFRPAQSDIAHFNSSFSEMRSLWMTRLSTSLEEHNRMQEQVETSGRRVKDLMKTLDDKSDQLEKFTKNAKEHKEARRVEIDNLKLAKGELRTEKNTRENQLTADGQKIKEAMNKRHEDTMKQLKETIEQFNGELLEVKNYN